MEYLLDTNICIYYFKGLYHLNEKFQSLGYHRFAISEITLAELVYGAEKSQRIKENMDVVVNFSENIIILPIFDSIGVYAKEKARLKTKGTVVSDLDLFIGATAIINGLTLVTRNVRDFARMQGIHIENWIDTE